MPVHVVLLAIGSSLERRSLLVHASGAPFVLVTVAAAPAYERGPHRVHGPSARTSPPAPPIAHRCVTAASPACIGRAHAGRCWQHAIWGGAVALTARLSLLGGFRLEVDGQPHPVPASARRLLALLAVVHQGRRASRSALAEMMRPDSDPARRPRPCGRSSGDFPRDRGRRSCSATRLRCGCTPSSGWTSGRPRSRRGCCAAARRLLSRSCRTCRC